MVFDPLFILDCIFCILIWFRTRLQSRFQTRENIREREREGSDIIEATLMLNYLSKFRLFYIQWTAEYEADAISECFNSKMSKTCKRTELVERTVEPFSCALLFNIFSRINAKNICSLPIRNVVDTNIINALHACWCVCVVEMVRYIQCEFNSNFWLFVFHFYCCCCCFLTNRYKVFTVYVCARR